MTARGQLWVIEKRHADGRLDFSEPSVYAVFGMAAIIGLDEDALAKAVYRRVPDVILDGRETALWPAKVNPRFIARRKTG